MKEGRGSASSRSMMLVSRTEGCMSGCMAAQAATVAWAVAWAVKCCSAATSRGFVQQQQKLSAGSRLAAPDA